MDTSTDNAVLTLQQVLAEEREKRVAAEEYAKALVEEFTACSDFEEVRQKFRDKIKEIAPQALINIVRLANTAESESVQANLNKWILEWAMSDRIDGTSSDLNNLLKKLATTNTPTPTSK